MESSIKAEIPGGEVESSRTENTAVEVKQNQSTEEILQRNRKFFSEKMISSLEEMLAVSRYSRDDTLSELGLGTEVFVTLVLALANRDINLCVTLIKLAETVSPLLTANQYMVHQMLETFQISPRDIQGAVEYLEILEGCSLFNIPGSIGTILRHVSDIVIGQPANAISSKEISIKAEIPEDEVESSRTELSEVVEVKSELEAVNDKGEAGDLPN